MKAWNLIIDRRPLKGSWNMAVDEYLFSLLDEKPQTFVRFYQWERPTVSLGYSQDIDRVVDLEFCSAQGIDIVRRITGGKLVLHHHEVTYSICSSDREIFGSTLAESYRTISQALMRGLEGMGLEPSLAPVAPQHYARGNLPCFSHPARDEIEVQGRKIVGSAQKRVGQSFIQHGSIPIAHDETLLRSVSRISSSRLKDDEEQVRMTSLSRALGQDVSFEWAVGHLVSGISGFFGMTLGPLVFTPAEIEAVARIQRERYECREWTFSRKFTGEAFPSD